jgi:hypothetical protein
MGSPWLWAGAGSTTCNPCGLGQYQTASKQSSCLECPVGTQCPKQAISVGWRLGRLHVETRYLSAWMQRLKLLCDAVASSFAFHFNLRPYFSSLANYYCAYGTFSRFTLSATAFTAGPDWLLIVYRCTHTAPSSLAPHGVS